MAEEWINTEICMDFYNTSADDITIKYGFVDWSVTADEFKNKACKNEGEIDNFWQYLTQNNTEILVPAWWSVRQKAYAKFPVWLSWLIHGCLTYYVKNDDAWQSNNTFNVLVRKAAFIDVLVWWNLERSLKISQDSVSYNHNTNKGTYDVSIKVENKWNIDEMLSFVGKVSNKLWYSATISGDSQKILSDDSGIIQFELKDLPRYKMSFDIDLHIVSDPVFAFNPDMVPDDMKWSNEMNLHLSIFVFPWVLIYSVLWFLLLCLIISYLSKHLSFK